MIVPKLMGDVYSVLLLGIELGRAFRAVIVIGIFEMEVPLNCSADNG